QGQENGVSSITFTQRGALIISVDGETLRVWDTATGKPIRRHDDEETVGGPIALSPDDKLLVSAGCCGICVREIATGKQIHVSPMASGWVESLGFIDDNRVILAPVTVTRELHGESWIAFWDARTGQEIRRLSLGELAAIWRFFQFRAFSPDGCLAISTGHAIGSVPGLDPPVQVWDAAKGDNFISSVEKTRARTWLPFLQTEERLPP